MKEKYRDDETLRDKNDETPDNFTRYGDGHKWKVEKKYTDGEPPEEDETPYASPSEPEIPKEEYP